MSPSTITICSAPTCGSSRRKKPISSNRHRPLRPQSELPVPPHPQPRRKPRLPQHLLHPIRRLKSRRLRHPLDWKRSRNRHPQLRKLHPLLPPPNPSLSPQRSPPQPPPRFPIFPLPLLHPLPTRAIAYAPQRASSKSPSSPSIKRDILSQT